MKIGIVGAGSWGSNLIRNFCEIIGDEKVVVCDARNEKTSKIQEIYPEIETTKNLKDILLNAQIQAVVVATPTATHYRIAKDVLLSGKHLFVEKPITLNVKEAEELIELSEKKNLTLMVDHLLEYHPAVEEMKKLIEKGELGEIYYIYSQRLNLGPIRSPENALWSLGPHDVSIYLYLIGEEPNWVSATGGAYIQKDKRIHDTVFVNLHFSSGIDAYSQLSWLDPNKIRRLTVVGSEKMAVFDDMEPRNKLTIFDKGAEWREEGGVEVRYGDIHIPNIPLIEPLRLACNHFLKCIREKKRPRSDGYDGLRVLKVLERAQKSLEKGREE
ncbi:MAG: Gfo/Idh/MocA family oxidoreductase [candidate division WOR-3 bacterium]|nr:Gfo/Idh/MocA family oxidoreductase [candidate division WOR-3 bacterium]